VAPPAEDVPFFIIDDRQVGPATTANVVFRDIEGAALEALNIGCFGMRFSWLNHLRIPNEF
jgi:hypothetical protein